MIILITAAQLIFLTFFHRYIAWPTTAPDGTVTRLSMLTDAYFTWLPFPITASILVIVASIVMIIWDSYWFRQAAWVGFCLIGIAVVVALVTIFPFDFSVLPNATAVEVVPKAVTVFLILHVTFHGIAAVVLFLRLRKRMAGGHR
jgi:hypothetical protein